MVRLLPVLEVLSVVIVMFALAMLLPLGVSFLYDDAAAKLREANNEFLGEGVGAYKA